jgi:hypothetical protein
LFSTHADAGEERDADSDDDDDDEWESAGVSVSGSFSSQSSSSGRIHRSDSELSSDAALRFRQVLAWMFMPCSLASGLRCLGWGSQVGGVLARFSEMAWRQRVVLVLVLVVLVVLVVPVMVLRFFEGLETDAGDAARDRRGDMSVAHVGNWPYMALLRS